MKMKLWVTAKPNLETRAVTGNTQLWFMPLAAAALCARGIDSP